MTIPPKELTINSLMLSSTLYLAKITPYSPVYIISTVCIIFASIWTFKNTRFNLPTDARLAGVWLLYILITQIDNFSGEFINISIGLAGYITVRLMKINSIEKLANIYSNAFNFNVLILGTDSIYRISNPTAPTNEHLEVISQNEDLLIYLYKFNTLMFADSNTVALITLIFLFTLYVINKDIKVKISINSLWVWAMIGILFSTLSRAAIFSAIVAYFICTLGLKVSKRIQLMAILFLLWALFAIISLSEIKISDGSFNSKIDILSIFFDRFFKDYDVNSIIFGVGFNEYEKILGMSTHILIISILSSTGILGLMISFIFFTYYSIKYSFNILLPVAIASLSYFLYIGTPFLFIPIALIASLADTKKH